MQNSLDRAQSDMLDAFIATLTRSDSVSENTAVAIQTAHILRSIISKRQFTSISAIIDTLHIIGRKITSAVPMRLTIGNIIRRILFIVRNEARMLNGDERRSDTNSAFASTDVSPATTPQQRLSMSAPSHSAVQNAALKKSTSNVALSLAKLIDNQSADADTLEHNAPANKLPTLQDDGVSRLRSAEPDSADLLSLKLTAGALSAIQSEIDELIEEMNGAEDAIAEQSEEHIYARETILTLGFSRTLCAFLQSAARHRTFDVFVAECAPSYSGHQTALALSAAGISTTLIPDSAVYALMPTVNKVFIGAHNVMANGGVIGVCGSANVALAANYCHKPVVVLTGLHELCPLYAFDADTFNVQRGKSQLLDFTADWTQAVAVANPAFDYIPPNNVTLFITNIGGHNPSYIYRLLQEYYHTADYEL